jgi:uncharacterized protein YbjQ (UPF0145 family)
MADPRSRSSIRHFASTRPYLSLIWPSQVTSRSQIRPISANVASTPHRYSRPSRVQDCSVSKASMFCSLNSCWEMTRESPSMIRAMPVHDSANAGTGNRTIRRESQRTPVDCRSGKGLATDQRLRAIYRVKAGWPMKTMVQCPSCEGSFYWDGRSPKTCRFCGANVDDVAAGLAREKEAAVPSHIKEAQSRNDYSKLTLEEIENHSLTQKAAASIILTTTPLIPGVVTYEIIDIVVTETALGMNLLRDFAAGVTDILGGNSNATERVLGDGRKACLTGLRMQGLQLKANAIVGVSLGYSEISGGGKSMLFAVASGTAIRFDRGESL